MGVAECVGDGFDAGEPGVGCVAGHVDEVDATVPCAGVAILTMLKLSPSGSKSLPTTNDIDQPASIHTSHIITGHGWLVGVAGGEDADLDV